MKGILIIGAGTEAYEGIRIAKQMGLKLIVADADTHAPGFELADQRIIESTYDGQAIARKSLALIDSGVSIDGVIAMCADVPMSAATVAEELGLISLSMESAHWVADKLLMKDQLAKAGVPIPRYCELKESDPFNRITQKVGIPFVIKPADSRGARGVQLIENEKYYQNAYIEARHHSPSKRVLAEEYLPGPQVSTETLIEAGHCYTIGFSDRNYEWLEKTKPYFIENGGDAPSNLPESQRKEIIETVENAALALNIKNGVAKGDMVMTDTGAKVIEIAGRLSGGYFSTTQIPCSTGVNFVKQAINIALGIPLNKHLIQPSKNQGVAIRYLETKPGIVKKILGAELVRKQPGFELMGINIRPGDEIFELSNHTKRAGFVIFSGSSKANAIKRAQQAIRTFEISYE